MRILHVIPSIAAVHGGPSRAVREMAGAVLALGHEVEIATTDDEGPGLRGTVGEALEDGVMVRRFAKQTDFYKVSRPLGWWLEQRVRGYDVVHIHALFSHTSIIAARIARRNGVPYILRPLGVLGRYGREKRRPFLKGLSLRWVEGPLLRDAAAIHYTSSAEQLEAEEGGVRGRAVILPLGIPAVVRGDAALFVERFGGSEDEARVLFLSRLDPKKGIEVLLQAWAMVRSPARLIIAGDGAPAYVAQLKSAAERAGVAERVVWTGQLEGELKTAAFAAASVFVLPSYSENFGIAAVEALSAGVPVILSEGVAVSREVAAAGAGVVVRPEPRMLAAAIEKLLAEPDEARCLGERGRELAAREFSTEAMATRLVAMYRECATRRKA